MTIGRGSGFSALRRGEVAEAPGRQDPVREFYAGKQVLITGAAGTVGRAVAGLLSTFGPAELRLMDNSESEMFFLMEECGKDARCLLGDVRDGDKLRNLSEDIDITVHCAAFKHVTLSEYSPFDAVQTNIIGVENVIRAAKACGVKHVLFTSSDKAVNPTSVMGTSKLMGEKLITAANASRANGGPVFSSTRFGNVIGSRGSVVPLFMKQIKGGGPVTLTDHRMTRFIMTPEEAAALVASSASMARGGEVFVTKMPVVRILDLAVVMIELLAPRCGRDPRDIRIEEVGAKPGEKLYEELMSEEEARRSVETQEMFIIKPAFRSVYPAIDFDYAGSRPAEGRYVSGRQRPLEKNALKRYLAENAVLERIEEPTL